MVERYDVKEHKSRGEQALKTIPIRVNAHTVIHITEAQRADKKFMKRFCERWGVEIE